MRFSWTARLLVATLLASTLFGAAACAGSGEAAREQTFRRNFRIVYKRYRKYEPKKSLALARDEEGHWAYGFSRETSKELKAINEAIANCKRRRARYGVTSRCRTYAIGNEIIGDPTLVADPSAPQEK